MDTCCVLTRFIKWDGFTPFHLSFNEPSGPEGSLVWSGTLLEARIHMRGSNSPQELKTN